MSRSILSLLVVIFGFGCTSSPVIDSADDNRGTSEVRPVGVSTSTPLVVAPVVKLTGRQKQLLDSSLPADARKVLESASEFTLQGEIVRTDNGVEYPVKEGFEPNTVADIANRNLRTEILEAFYTDVSNGEEPSNCWLPHHKLRARMGDQVVEIEICFQCSRFYGVGPSGKFFGTFAHGDSPKSETLFNKILVDQGRPIE